MTAARLATAALLLIAAAVAALADEPYKRMLDDELSFTGTETLTESGTSKDAIVIGLFSPDDDDHPVGRALTRGVTLAVDQVNAAGGIEGRPIRLVRRWADDPWGAGANDVVKLVFEDQAWAIIGGPDGASTHIAQQVATKAHIPLIAPVSSDPSLTHTRVPWIFRLPPDDAAQAGLLVARAVTSGGLGRIVVLTSTDHDGRTAATELIAALESAEHPPIAHLELTPDLHGFEDIARRIASFSPEGLFVRVPHGDLRRLAAALAEAGSEIPIFAPWIPGVDLRRFPLAYAGPVIALAPFEEPRSCGPYLKLVRAYIARFGDKPTPTSVYGYDAAGLIIDSIESGAAGRAGLRRALAGVEHFPGASGPIRWDTGGGNLADGVLIEIGSSPDSPAPIGDAAQSAPAAATDFR